MGGKGDIDISGGGGADPRDDYAHMHAILSDDFPVFSDGAGEVEEIPNGLTPDAGLYYFQSSYVFDTFPGSDGFFGFSDDTTYNDQKDTLIEVVEAGDYFINFSNNRIYSYSNNFADSYVHLCESQLTVTGGGPLTDFDYEVITELYPSQAPPEDPTPYNQEYMLNELVRWDNGKLLAHTAFATGNKIYGTWDYYGFWGIMHSSDNGLSWAFPNFTGSIPYPHLGKMSPYPSEISLNGRIFVWAPDTTIVLAKIYDRDWDVPGPSGFLCQLWWSIDGGANFVQGWNMQDWAAFPSPRWTGNTGITSDTLALDQRYRYDILNYAGEHSCFITPNSGQPAEFFHVPRTGILGQMVPNNTWPAPNNQQAGQCRSVLVGNDNHMLFTTTGGELWKSINHAPPVKLVDDWRDLYPAGPEKDAASGLFKPYTFTPETDDIWVWNNGTARSHLWHSSDAGVTWTWLTDPNNGGSGPDPGHPNGGVLQGDGSGLIRLSDNKFLAMVTHWPRNKALWLSEDGGVTWSKIVTYPGFGFGTPDPAWPYPDPVTSTKFTAAEGNNGGLHEFSNFVPEGVAPGNETEFYLWCGAAAAELSAYPAQDEVMRVMRIKIFPDDAVIQDICDEAGFVIRALHINELRRKLQILNNTVQTGGTNHINFGIDVSDLPTVSAQKTAIRRDHYHICKRETDGVIGQVGTVPGSAYYCDVDLTEFSLLMPEPVVDDPVSIRTLIGMRKTLQALYSDGWFCACFSYCPCQTHFEISGGGSKK